MKPSQSNTMERFFKGLSENTFHSSLGVVDPKLIGYISKLLIRFVRLETVHKIRSLNGRPILALTELVNEASHRLGDARREVHQHVGDFALFWLGLFPEAVSHDIGEDVAYKHYCSHGKRAYQIASRIETAKDDADSPEVLEQLSEQFELCVYGMQEVRREWQNPENDNGIIVA